MTEADVTVIMPSRKFDVEHIQAGDSAANALPCQNAYDDFCNVEPASVSWSVVQFKPFYQRTRFISQKRFIERSDDVRVKVVDNEFDFQSVREVYRQQILDFMRPINSCSLFARVGICPPCQGLRENENGASPHADILIVDFLNAARLHRDRFTAFSQQLIRLFVHANNGTISVIWQMI